MQRILPAVILLQLPGKPLHRLQNISFQINEDHSTGSDQDRRQQDQHHHAAHHYFPDPLSGDLHPNGKRRLRQLFLDRVPIRFPHPGLFVQNPLTGEHPHTLPLLIDQAHISVFPHGNAGKGLQDAFHIDIASQIDPLILCDLTHIILAAACDDVPFLFHRIGHARILQMFDLPAHRLFHILLPDITSLRINTQPEIPLLILQIKEKAIFLPILPCTGKEVLAQLYKRIIQIVFLIHQIHIIPKHGSRLVLFHHKREETAADSLKTVIQLARIQLRHLIKLLDRQRPLPV